MKHSQDKYDSHCTRPGCGCEHINCYKGWVDSESNTTYPCLYCNENLSSRLMRATLARDGGYPQAAISRIMQKATQ